jgi:hypothetical protein
MNGKIEKKDKSYMNLEKYIDILTEKISFNEANKLHDSDGARDALFDLFGRGEKEK